MHTQKAETISTHFANMCQSLLGLDLTSLPPYLPTPSPLSSVHKYKVQFTNKRFSSQIYGYQSQFMMLHHSS